MSINIFKFFAFTSLFLFFTGTPFYAQEIAIESVDITGEILSGRNTIVLNEDDIQSLEVNSTDELLRYIPGIETQSRGGFGVQSDITLRGSTFNQVLILIDGVRINDPLTGHFNGYIPISLEEIDRVEVTKGAAASIYGADAVGGVINFITKYSQYDYENSGSIEFKKGSNNYTGINAALIQKDSSGWFYGGSMSNNYSLGETFSNPNFTNYQLGPEEYTTFFDLATYGIAIGKQIDEKWRIHLRAAGDLRNFNAKYFYTASSYDESVEDTKVLTSQLHINRVGNKTNTTIDLSQRFGQDEFTFNPIFPINNHRSQFYLLQANQFFVVSDRVNLNYGIQTDWRMVFSNDRGNHENFHAGSHFLTNYKITSDLTTNFGVRGDWDDNYEFELNPHFTLLYEKSKFNIRGSFNRAIRAPDYTERFISTELVSLSPGRNLGNPNLKAESSWNAEIGTKFILGKNQSISTTYFSRYSSNLIDYALTLGQDITTSVELTPTADYNYALNLGKIVTNGLEVDWSIFNKINEKLSFSGKLGYTWLETKKDSKFWSLENSDGLPPTKYLNSHASHLINGFLIVNYDKFTLSTHGIWKQRKTAFSEALGFPARKDYLIANLSLDYKFIDKTSIGITVNNIGDIEVQDIFGSILPKRWIIGVFKIQI